VGPIKSIYWQRKRHTALIIAINILSVLTMMLCGSNSPLLLLMSRKLYFFHLSFWWAFVLTGRNRTGSTLGWCFCFLVESTLASITSCKREAATICPASHVTTFDLLTLKVVSESRVTCATSVPILVFLVGPLCSRLRPDVRDRQTSDSIIA